MSRAAHIRETIAQVGPLSINQLAALLPYPRAKVAAWVWDMEKKGTLKREAELFVLGRAPMTNQEKAVLGNFGKGRNYARPPSPDALWRAWREHPVPAFARGHLSPLIGAAVAA